MDFGLLPLDNSHIMKLSFIPKHLLNLIEYQRGLSDFNPEQPQDYMLYTGRGPSQGSFHIGHLPGIQLIKAFQKYLNSKIFFMISDDEKIFRDNVDREEMNKNVDNTLIQLNDLGLTEEITQYHINSNGISKEYYNILIRLMGLVSINVLNNIFGEKGNIGEYFYPLYQILPCFLGKQCIIIAGKDQDPFFRIARELARRIGHKPPIVIYTKSVPGLDGSEKMSTSIPGSLPIFLTDSIAIIKNKISKVKKVGTGSLDELFEYGCNLEKDTLYDLIKIFEADYNMINIITRAYTIGYDENAEELQYLRNMVGVKGVVVRNGRGMITTEGIRTYVTQLIQTVICLNN